MTDTATPRTTERTTPPLPTSDKALQLAGRTVNVRFHGDADAKSPRPLVLHFHGGWFSCGTLDDGASVARLFADAGALVASVDYPLAPEHPFPVAIDIGYAALEWLATLKARRAHPTPVVLVGEEAGGNLAAAVAMMARDRDPELAAGQVLISPLLDPCMASASVRQASIGVGGCSIACGWKEYLAQPGDISHPYAAPAAAVRLSGMAPALLLSFTGHPLHDDARRYAARLTGAGVEADELDVAADPRKSGAAWPVEVQARVRQFLAEHASGGVTPR